MAFRVIAPLNSYSYSPAILPVPVFLTLISATRQLLRQRYRLISIQQDGIGDLYMGKTLCSWAISGAISGVTGVGRS